MKNKTLYNILTYVSNVICDIKREYPFYGVCDLKKRNKNKKGNYNKRMGKNKERNRMILSYLPVYAVPRVTSRKMLN